MNVNQCTVVSSFVVLTALATADTVTTSDGSRFVGTIEQVSDGTLVLVNDIVGRLEISAAKITAITTDGAAHIQFSTGDTLVGTIAEAPGQAGAIVKSALGEIHVTPGDIAVLWPKGKESPEVVALREKSAAALEAARPKWSTVLEAGAIYTEGNNDTLKGHGRFNAKRSTETDLLHFYVAGKYDEQNDARTSNEYLGGVRYEENISAKWLWYARSELEFDEFEDLDLRATAAAGVGYRWFDSPEHALKTSAGLGYRHESYDTGRSEDDAVIDLGLDYRLAVWEWATFTHSTVYSPDFEDFDNYRLKLDTALAMPFKDDRWAWKIGMRNDYNSRPQPGLERLDTEIYTSIVLTLK
jgi:putative salt-induced outer membrane protein YdiY